MSYPHKLMLPLMLLAMSSMAYPAEPLHADGAHQPSIDALLPRGVTGYYQVGTQLPECTRAGGLGSKLRQRACFHAVAAPCRDQACLTEKAELVQTFVDASSYSGRGSKEGQTENPRSYAKVSADGAMWDELWPGVQAFARLGGERHGEGRPIFSGSHSRDDDGKDGQRPCAIRETAQIPPEDWLLDRGAHERLLNRRSEDAALWKRLKEYVMFKQTSRRQWIKVGPVEGDEGMSVEFSFRPSEDFENSNRAASDLGRYWTSYWKGWGIWMILIFGAGPED